MFVFCTYIVTIVTLSKSETYKETIKEKRKNISLLVRQVLQYGTSTVHRAIISQLKDQETGVVAPGGRGWRLRPDEP